MNVEARGHRVLTIPVFAVRRERDELHLRAVRTELAHGRAYHVADWSADPYARGGYCAFPTGTADLPAAIAEPIDATLYFAGEATSTDLPGTVQGALTSGRRAAQSILIDHAVL